MMSFGKFYFCLVAMLSSATVQVSAEESNLFGAGEKTCAQFEESYDQNAEVAEVVYYSWAAGFMSGMNAGAHAIGLKPKNLSAYPLVRQKQFIRQWCFDHPRANYIDAVTILLKSMPSTADN